MRLIRFRAAAALAAALAVGAGSARAGWLEAGDAGELPSTAQVSTGLLDFIAGAVSPVGDADMYLIHIANPAAFRATTVGTGGTLTDTQLFLFDSAGRGVLMNDDASSVTMRSTLPGFAGLAGNYYLAVTGYDRDPVSPGGQIFPDNPFNAVHGPTGPGGASPISGWNGGSATGTYRINLQGVSAAQAVPAPPAAVLAAIGMAGFGGLGWLRRRNAAA
jgi:hypothetical protein